METAARGVRVRVIVPGPRTDQRLVRLASRRLYGELLEAGVRIYEYQPGMTHAKALMIDGRLAVIGTTNIDNRSFEHNDEVNVAFRDPEVVARLTHDFEAGPGAERRDHLRAVAAAPAAGKGVEAADVAAGAPAVASRLGPLAFRRHPAASG